MRVISGKHKGKTLFSPKTDNVRPTLDMVKQAFFTKIQFVIPGCKFLDLFGGSGAIGIEAISRGAEEVTIVDNSSDSITLIKKNLSLINESANVVFCDYKKFLKTNKLLFDIIFIDPPYGHQKAYEYSLRLIKENTQLHPDGLVVCEHGVDLKFDHEGWEVVDQKKYGTVMLTYLKQNNDVC